MFVLFLSVFKIIFVLNFRFRFASFRYEYLHMLAPSAAAQQPHSLRPHAAALALFLSIVSPICVNTKLNCLCAGQDCFRPFSRVVLNFRFKIS